MVDKKFIRLMNLGLDGVLSPEDRRVLEDYLSRNPEAKSYNAELGAAWAALRRANEVEAKTVDLKNEVLGSLRRAAAEARSADRSRGTAPAIPALHHLRLKYVFFFACGLALGVMLFLLFKSQGGPTDFASQNLLGTLVSSKSLKVAERIPIEENGVHGEVVVKASDSLAVAEILVETTQYADLNLSFNPEALALTGYQRESEGAGSVRLEADYLTVAGVKALQCRVGFKVKAAAAVLRVHIASSGVLLYERDITLTGGRMLE
jgi:hypothetical protein